MTKVLKPKLKQLILALKTSWDKHCDPLENSGSSSLVADLSLLFIYLFSLSISEASNVYRILTWVLGNRVSYALCLQVGHILSGIQ